MIQAAGIDTILRDLERSAFSELRDFSMSVTQRGIPLRGTQYSEWRGFDIKSLDTIGCRYKESDQRKPRHDSKYPVIQHNEGVEGIEIEKMSEGKRAAIK